MKKLLLVTGVAILAMSGVNAQTVWNITESSLSGDYTETQIYNGLSIVPGTGGTISIDGSTKGLDGFSFTKRLKTGGGGFEDGASETLPTKRYLSFEVTGNAKITVYAMSSSSSADRQMIVSNGTEIIDESTVGGASLEKKEINYTGPATTVYLYSRSSGLNFYCIVLEQTETAVQAIDASKTVQSEACFDASGRKVSKDAKGLVFVKTTYEDGTSSTSKVYRLEK